jgi:HSP20 family protein
LEQEEEVMAMMRWDPFRELGLLQDRMNRLFEDAGRGWRADEPSATTSWSPAVDIYETEGEIIVQAELPGVERNDITLNLENNVLTLKGERRFEKETKQENYHRIERSYGTFSRTFSIPAIVNDEKIRADYKDGILKIALPKKDQVKPKQIKIGE